MEESKHSEEEIIKLGEKLVKEFNLEYSTNTLARWMSHYLAELIQNIENVTSEEEKKILKKECCDVILKLWSQKEDLPIKKPLEDLIPVIEILEVISEKKEVNINPTWISFRPLPRNNQWAVFADLIKNNSEKIFSQIIDFNLHKDILLKDVEWMKDNKGFLSDDQINFLQIIDLMNQSKFRNGVFDFNEPKEVSDDNTKRIEYFFSNLENLIDEQKTELQKIKEKYLKVK